MRLPLLFLAAISLFAQDGKYRPDGEIIPGPPAPADHDAWLADIRHWRMEHLIRAGYNGAEYARPELKWSQRNFIQPQMMCEDRYFFDPVANKYTVDRYLDDLEKRYGGIDSVLIWHVYPNIGIDARSQFDLFRDLPGGLSGVKRMIADFHRRNVKVFFPMMPWDQGTHDPGTTDAIATAKQMAQAGVDGVNGDTFSGIPRTYRVASDATGHPLVFEPEGKLDSDEMLTWNNQSWGYWKYNFIPSVSLYKWLEPRHMVNICRRWARDRTDDLQHAFFNGVGYESWENIWGIWNGIDERDAEALRRIAAVERQYAPWLVSAEWEPHVRLLRGGAFASRFPASGGTLWTIVNRNEYPLHGPQMEVTAGGGVRYWDVWNGVELHPQMVNGKAVLSFDMEAFGYGAIVTGAQPDTKFLARMNELSRTPLEGLPHEWKAIPQTMVEIPPTPVPTGAPVGMVKVPAGQFTFKVSGIEIEGANEEGVDVQYPWEKSARRSHLHPMNMKAFYMDKFPVTNADFAKFLSASHYRPRDEHNFLADWKNAKFPQGWDNKPVTWVSIEDARAYAKWAGKRLPHEWEWQYAAQGTDGRVYPWGNEWIAANVPVPDKGRTMREPDNVDAHPAGASPFGVMDLAGNVYQWTDEFVDQHTRAGIVRGGNHFQPQGSKWYFPQAYRNDEHGKYLLMAPAKDRSAGVGFRCVVDAE